MLKMKARHQSIHPLDPQSLQKYEQGGTPVNSHLYLTAWDGNDAAVAGDGTGDDEAETA